MRSLLLGLSVGLFGTTSAFAQSDLLQIERDAFAEPRETGVEETDSEATADSRDETHADSQDASAESEDAEDAHGEVIASSRGGQPLPPLGEPPHSRRVSRNVGLGYAGALAGFAATQVLCAFGALRGNADSFLQLAKFCGALGAALGFGFGTPAFLRGEGRRWAGYPGAVIGTGAAFALALIRTIPLGVAGVALAVLPVALSLLGYEISDRRMRRRRERFTRVFLAPSAV
ncbi:MAG: hypothetical protein AAGE52_25110 [Myxococcota bacterium]